MNSERDYASRLSRASHAPRRKPHVRALLFVAAALLTSLAAQASVVCVAQSRPNIANEVEGNEKPRSGSEKPKSGGAPAASSKSSGESKPKMRTPRTTPARQFAGYSVVLITRVPQADIYLQRADTRVVKLGRTGADGRLVARLPRGTHELAFTHAGYLTGRQQIDVRPGNTTFTLNLTRANSSDGDATAATAATPASAPAASAAEVIRRFLDPRLSDSVTPRDWQAAAAQANAAYAQNQLEPQLQAQALFTTGQLAFLRGDYGNAVVSFNASALVLPKSALAYLGLGNAYLASGQLSEATRGYQRAIELNSQLARAYKGMGDVLSRQGKNKDALGYYERARALGYVSNETNLGAARTLLKQRRWQQALRELEEISRKNPSAEVFIGIGDCYVGLEKPFSAAPAYRRAAELDPKSALAHYKYGALVYDMREYASASEALERALALDPTGATIDRARAREMVNKAGEKMRKMK